LQTNKIAISKLSTLLFYRQTKISNENCLEETTIHVDTIFYFITLLLGKRFGTLA